MSVTWQRGTRLWSDEWKGCESEFKVEASLMRLSGKLGPRLQGLMMTLSLSSLSLLFSLQILIT